MAKAKKLPEKSPASTPTKHRIAKQVKREFDALGHSETALKEVIKSNVPKKRGRKRAAGARAATRTKPMTLRGGVNRSKSSGTKHKTNGSRKGAADAAGVTPKQSMNNDLRGKVVRFLVDYAEARYKSNCNPLDAWNAILAALLTGVEIPPESRRYLCRVSTRLGNLVNPAPDDVQGFVMAALELKLRGGPSFFAQRIKQSRASYVIGQAKALSRPVLDENGAPVPGARQALNFSQAMEQAAENHGIEPDSVLRRGRKRTKHKKLSPLK